MPGGSGGHDIYGKLWPVYEPWLGMNKGFQFIEKNGKLSGFIGDLNHGTQTENNRGLWFFIFTIRK